MKTIKDLVDFDNPESSYYYEKIEEMDFIIKLVITSLHDEGARNPMLDEGTCMHYSIQTQLGAVIFDVILDISKFAKKKDEDSDGWPGIYIGEVRDRYGRELTKDLADYHKNLFSTEFFKYVKQCIIESNSVYCRS